MHRNAKQGIGNDWDGRWEPRDRGSQGLSEIECHCISNRSILTRSSECGPQHFVRHNCKGSRSSSYAGAFYFKISPSAELASGV